MIGVPYHRPLEVGRGEMEVYCVRHAESKLNALNIHQIDSVGLSELGVRQAQRLAQRLVDRPIDVIVSSPYERARQTADIISRAMGQPISLSPLLAEVRNPTKIVGKHHDDPEAVRIKQHIRENFHVPGWRFTDEETFEDLKGRGRACLQYVRGLGRENVLLVTHGGFITMLVALMLYGDDVQSQDFLRLRLFTQMRNTGITHCVCTPDGGWSLVTWNDHAHLECREV